MFAFNYPFLILIILFVIFAAANGAIPSDGTFYDVLKSNGLPMGIFPKGISDFSFDSDSGRFELNLMSPSPCDANFETRVRYTCNITGHLNYGKIANLSGVAAQELFLWLTVKSIQVDIPSSGLIHFDVGMVLKQFSLSFFETPKDCNAIEKGDGEGNAIFLFNDHGRIVENQFGNVLQKHDVNKEHRADS